MISRRGLLAGLGASVAASHAAAQARGPLILAAASLQESMSAAAAAWARRGHARPVCSFAATPALARQILAGARADLFVSADEAWMDQVQRGGRIVPGTRAAFLGNRLVVVATRSFRGRQGPPGAPLRDMLSQGRVAIADPASVPAGRYARAALERLGIWERVAPRIVRAESVRAALALVERGAAQHGVVYATDARASQRVRVVQILPEQSHPPIRYPLARLTASMHPDAEGFRRFLLSAQGRAIFRQFGFLTL